MPTKGGESNMKHSSLSPLSIYCRSSSLKGLGKSKGLTEGNGRNSEILSRKYTMPLMIPNDKYIKWKLFEDENSTNDNHYYLLGF